MYNEYLLNILISQKNTYLDEYLLEKYLLLLFPNTEIVHNKAVPSYKFKNRPDFRIEQSKLIVEFDGYHHYTKHDVILKDERCNIDWKIWVTL